MEQVIRCLHEKDFVALKNGECKKGFVRVYYGFNNYDDSPTHINQLADIIRDETYVDDKDMHVHFVTRDESIRHAHCTMIQITEDVYRIKDNMANYTIL